MVSRAALVSCGARRWRTRQGAVGSRGLLLLTAGPACRGCPGSLGPWTMTSTKSLPTMCAERRAKGYDRITFAPLLETCTLCFMKKLAVYDRTCSIHKWFVLQATIAGTRRLATPIVQCACFSFLFWQSRPKVMCGWSRENINTDYWAHNSCFSRF
jgi:hypothetical protein